jgi:glycosyltransferase involved in cell wall biosynthesis
MTQPLISAIICTHNRASYLGAAIDSLLGQTYAAYEVIVVDNASTDDTRAVVEARLPHPQLTYCYEGTLGLSAARNRGAAIAHGSLLAYLDDDAEASADWLAALAEAFVDYPQAAIAGGSVSLLWPADCTPPRWLSPTLAESLGAYDWDHVPAHHRTLAKLPRGLNYAVKKSFLDAAGGFDPSWGGWAKTCSPTKSCT